jgi:hypothetical protein
VLVIVDNESNRDEEWLLLDSRSGRQLGRYHPGREVWTIAGRHGYGDFRQALDLAAAERSDAR